MRHLKVMIMIDVFIINKLYSRLISLHDNYVNLKFKINGI